MQTHIVLTFVGVLVAVGLVAWIQPLETGGTTFIVVVTLLAVNAIGAVVRRMMSRSAGTR